MGLKTLFVITITTAKMIMPGMPEMPKPPPGIKMPDYLAPTRTLTMDLTSDKAANAQSKAECGIPGGLKLGPKVNLHINLPEKTMAQDSTGKDSEKAGKTPKFTIRSYWTCSETVPPGQPKVVDMAEMAASAQKAMRMNKNIRLPKGIEGLAEGSHAYWPYNDVRRFDSDAVAPGQYALSTNYCGDTTITLDRPQDFLAAIDLTSPGKNIDLAEPIRIEWKSVPNAAAYVVTAFSGNGQEMITWTSSSNPDPATKVQFEAITSDELQKYINQGILLPPTATSCCIPAGIFKNTTQPMLTVTAVGVDKIQTKDDITTQVVVRSTATVMLGSPMGMQPGMNGGEEPAPGDVPEMPKMPTDESDQ